MNINNFLNEMENNVDYKKVRKAAVDLAKKLHGEVDYEKVEKVVKKAMKKSDSTDAAIKIVSNTMRAKPKNKSRSDESVVSILDVLSEKKKKKEKLSDACWDGYTAVGFKMKNGKKVPNCVPNDNLKEEQINEEILMLCEGEVISEAEYQGKKVELNKPFRTPSGPKKFAVYTKNEKGTVVKVTFGDPNMKIKKNIPARRKSFRARHGCDDPGPKWKARYWSCKAW